MIAQTHTPDDLRQLTRRDSKDLGATIRRTVEMPFATLAASIEALGGDFPSTDDQAAHIRRALEVLKVARCGVEALVDLVAPTDQVPLACTLEELARCAVRSTPEATQASVQVALEEGSERCYVDGPRFSRCLSYLLLANVVIGDEAMLWVRRDNGRATFSLLIPAAGNHQDAQPAAEFMQLVAERELIRMGASLERHEWESGMTQITASLPLKSNSGEEE